MPGISRQWLQRARKTAPSLRTSQRVHAVPLKPPSQVLSPGICNSYFGGHFSLVKAARHGSYREQQTGSYSADCRLPQIQRLEEVIPLVVDDDECREVLHLDAPDCLHAEF